MAAQRPRHRPGNLVPCSKQRCAGPATHQFSFDYQAKTVFLANYEGDLPYGAHALCVRHADSFTIPNGWQLDDRRRLEQPLFVQTRESTAPRRDEDHPAMRARKGIRVRRRPDLPGGYVPADDHPSGPLEIEDRDEPSDITRQIERLAHDLAGIGADPHSGSDVDRSSVRATERTTARMADGTDVGLDISDTGVRGIADGVVDYWDDDSTFGDGFDGEDTDVVPAAALVEGQGSPEEAVVPTSGRESSTGPSR